MFGSIFKYLQDKKGKPIPFMIKLLYNIPLNEDELIYNGNLDLRHSKINSLPDKLTVNGFLTLYRSEIKKLPNNLIVKDSLTISYTTISDLPEDLYIGGNLWCDNTPLGHNIKNDKSLLEKYKKQVKGKILW